MEKDRIAIIKGVVKDGMSKRAASVKLCRSMKTINRMIKRYLEFGEEGLLHGNKGRTPANKLDHDQIFLIYLNEYLGFNISHFVDMLRENKNIIVSEATVRTIFAEKNFISPKANRKTRRALKKKLEALKKHSPTEKDLLIQLEVEEYTGPIHPTKPRSKYFGQEIQMDASQHVWFGNIKMHLHLAIDDATGLIVGAYFDTQETLYGYYMVLLQILTTYGIPIKIKTDRRTIFEYINKKSKDMSEDTFTQFAHACNRLGIELEARSTPEFKARVERSFQTLQGRLIQEMGKAGVSTQDEANAFLNSYISKFNQQFAITDGITPCFDKQPSQEQIDQTLVTFTKRVISKGQDIMLNKKRYALHDKTGQQKFFRPGTKVSVITMLDKSQYVLHGDQLYALEEIPEREAFSKEVDFEEEWIIPVKKKKYIPPFDHPWRISDAKFFRNYAFLN